MLTEKDLDLISNTLNTNQYSWHIYLIMAILICLSSFVGAYLAQAAKNKANNENFNHLKSQLSNTTHIIKEIESSFSEKGWISQQVWLKKQESYEMLFTLLLDVKKYVAHQVNEFHEQEYIHNRYKYIDNVLAEADGDSSKWEEEKEKYDAMKADPTTQKEAELLKTKYDEALSKIFDYIDIKTIYLDKQVSEEIKKLKV